MTYNSSNVDMRRWNTHWEICGRDWSPAASSTLKEAREIGSETEQLLKHVILLWTLTPTLLRQGVAGWSTISVGHKTWVNANVLLLGSIESSFGPAGKHSVAVHN